VLLLPPIYVSNTNATDPHRGRQRSHRIPR
jgi:hypothetical protein